MVPPLLSVISRTRQWSGKIRSWVKKFECLVEENDAYESSYLCSRDLCPLPNDRRLWKWYGYTGYWIVAGTNLQSWTVGQMMLKLGLSVQQAMGIVITASLIIAAIAVGAGWPGSHQGIGFAVTSRSSWGIRASFWPVVIRLVNGVVVLGIQMYWGGQSVRIMLGGIIGPKFIFMQSTSAEPTKESAIDVACFLIFTLLLISFLHVSPERLQVPFKYAFAMITATLVGTFIWALNAAKSFGTLAGSESSISGSTLSWGAIYALQHFLGFYGGAALGQSDWTRHARTKNAALLGQALIAPTFMCLTVLVGTLIASASTEVYGETFWNPFGLLLYAQKSMTPASRAGTTFAGLGLLASQLALCIVLHSLASGMDLATLFPRYVNLRRGSYIVMMLAIATCPWILVKNLSTFTIVSSGWSLFLAPTTGILIADYFIVRRRQLWLDDLYTGNCTSAYWFLGGFNLRAIIAWIMGVWPPLPGFVRRVNGDNVFTHNVWDNIYRLNFFLGFGLAFTTHLALSLAFPPKFVKSVSPFKVRKQGFVNEGEDKSKCRSRKWKNPRVLEQNTTGAVQLGGESPGNRETER